jgi:serine/threonine-protein kinase
MAADIAQSRATPKYGTPLTMPAPVSAPSVPPHADDDGPTQVDAATRRLSAHTPKSLPPEAIQLLDEPSAVERRKELVDVVLSHSAPVIEPLASEPTVPNAPAVPLPEAPVRSGLAATPSPPAAAEKPASPEPSRGAEPAPRSEAAAPAMATSQPLTVGVGLVLANRYFLTCEIGQGAVAQVWNAYDRIKDEQVALKLLAGPAADNPLLVERFWRSAQQMSALSHPAIVGVLNKPREENGIHYVVMEYLSGDNLRQWVLLNKLTRAHLLRVMQRLAAGLQYAHERRTLHRNIKPSNILFDSTGHARLSDFGLVWPADAAQSKESRADRLIYMAPEEQLGDGQGDARSDVYSLGMCALFALVGKELASSAVTSRASLIESLDAPPQLKSAIKRAVAPNPADRFPTAADFSRALEIDAPALPGVSARHSTSVNSELRTSPSQRQPAVAPPPGAAPSPAAPASPPPKSSSSLPLPKLSMPEPLFKAEGQAEGDELQPPPGRNRNPAALAEYQIETDRIAAIQAEALATRSGTSLREPLPIQPPQRRFPWVLLASFGALVLVGGGLAGFLLVPGTRHAVSVGTTRPVEPAGGVQRPVVEPLAEPGARGDDKGGERPFVPVPVIPLKTDDPSAAGRTTPKAEGLKPGAKPAVQVADAKKAEAPIPAAKQEPGERPADSKLPVVASAKLQPEEELPPAGIKPEPVAKPEPAAKPAPVVAKAAPEPAKPAPVVAKAAPEPAKPAPVVAKAAPEPAKPAPEPAKPAPEPAKPAPVVAKPVTVVAGVPVKPATEPVKVAKVTPAAKPQPKAPPARAASPTPKVPVRVATAARDPMAEKTLNDAQDAFRRGERQTAISMALRVAQRGGSEAAQAWRFVGGAACSIRSPELATTAYRNIREPDQKRLLLDLCQRNGMRLNGHKFELSP